MKYVWIKYRTCHSAGPSHWMYEEWPYDDAMPHEANLNYILSEINERDSTQSEHWRGVEGDIIESPPRSWLEDCAKRLEEQLRETYMELGRVNQQREKTPWRYVLRLAPLDEGRRFVPDEELAESYEKSQGVTYRVDHALTFDDEDNAKEACDPDLHTIEEI